MQTPDPEHLQLEELHEIEVEYALTEPRPTGGISIDENLFRAQRVDEDEVRAFVLRWENTPIDEYIERHKELQLEELTMVVYGKTYTVTTEDVRTMKEDKLVRQVLHRFPPVCPGQPLISNIDVRSIDPETAVASYHRTEVDNEGEKYESESSLIVVRDQGRWKAAVFTRRPLPA